LTVSSATSRSVTSARVGAAALRMSIGLLVGLVLVLVFLRLVNFSGVQHRLQHLDIGLALLCSVAFLGAYVVRALRWRWFLGPDAVSRSRAVGVYLVATFLNWLLPVRGGELAKSLLLRRSNGIPVSRSLATVMMDKVMDLLPAVALLAILPVVHLHLSRSLWVLLLTTLAVLALGTVLLGLLSWRRDRTVALIARFLPKVLPGGAKDRVEPFIVRFIETLLAIVRQPRLLILTAAYTAVAVGLDALFCLLAFRAVGVNVGFPIVLYGYTFYNLAYILPTPPGQIGSNEIIGLLIFSGLFGVDRSGVGAMFLFSHPWTGILMTVSALVCLSAMGLTVRATFGLTREATPDEHA
jgi:uncharacterized protein (TIRG00374 family)